MRIRFTLARWNRRAFRLARTIVLALLTPLLEKNPIRTATLSLCYVPIVLSMARVIVLLFALGMLHQLANAGIADNLFSRFGQGAPRGLGAMYARQPSKLDDHTDDSGDKPPTLERAA